MIRAITFATNLVLLKRAFTLMKHTLQTALCLLFIQLFLVSCDDDKLNIDTSQIEIEVSMERLDSLWAKMTPVSFRREHPRLLDEHTAIYTHYIQDVLNLGKVTDSNLFAAIRSFVTHPNFSEVFTEVNTQYADLGPLQEELESAWRHYKYYFPQKQVPNHLACVGGFNSPFIMTENEVGICLELFLGRDCKYYEYLQWPLYQRKRMTNEHLTSWLMKGWLETEYPAQLGQTTLLQDIIHQGKILYSLDAILPHTGDTLKIGYTTKELQWAKEHERKVWAHFIDNEFLFNSDPNSKNKFTNDGPFTVDLVKESPSRMGYYIGWQIVRAYMDNRDPVDLEGLMQTGAQTILNQSKYKP